MAEDIRHLIPPEDVFRCDICGVVAPICEKHRVSILVHNKCGTNTDIRPLRINVCLKCLPNLMIMLELAIIKTSQSIVAKNGGIT